MVRVAVAIIRDGQGRLLLSQRQAHQHLGGLWEFPGGKLEAGESLAAGLVREIREELGIEVIQHRPLIRIRHQYPEKAVLLEVHLLLGWQGEPQGLEGQTLAWVGLDALVQEPDMWPLPAADLPILKALAVPDRYLIATWPSAKPAAYLHRLEQALIGGIRLVQFRPQAMGPGVIPGLWREVQWLCVRYQARLLCNSVWLTEVDADVTSGGLHLTATDLMTLDRRPPGFALVAASCHNPRELAQAARLGLDFALLSPVLPTSSHPGAPHLGWDTFADWVDGLALPVYALGGVGHCEPAIAWHYGAQGIAGIRGLW